ncbi:MAG: DegT/DnrJ/EryC1/StrS family aminotransferase [Candidatus Gastranaerophilales bacterium]|nr:DegT/DnrJ/EryC1/StrS family aminotransferase [Candidatus Gastranaerophilales bacterium]
MIPILDLTKQYTQIQEEAEKAVIDVMRSGCYILGNNVKKLESDFAKYCGTSYAIGVANGTDALHLALRALEIGAGDEVITVAFTFVATAEAIGLVGATPVFVDINDDTFNLDYTELEKKITSKTKAIIPVHLYGQPADMGPIMEIAKKYNLYVIEDCAQAVGAEYNGQKVGSFGDIGCFSFFPTKNLGCFGDGGIITTNSDYLNKKIIGLRNHGSQVRYYHEEIGLNSRLDEIQAAILNVKFKHIDKWNEERQENAYLYNELLKDVEDVVTPDELDGVKAVYHQYTIQVPNRDEMHKKLAEKGVMAMIYYPVPLHLQEVHKNYGFKKGDLPVTEALTERVLSLPMFPEMTEEQQIKVVEAIKECLAELKTSV